MAMREMRFFGIERKSKVLPIYIHILDEPASTAKFLPFSMKSMTGNSMATPNPSKKPAVSVIPNSNNILDFVTEGKNRMDLIISRMI